MRDARIGRVVAASLHDAIATLLPSRLEFYEAWLSPAALVHGRVPPSAVLAVLSFLRQDHDQYRAVAEYAGESAADWSVGTPSRSRDRFVRLLPARWRSRRALTRARQLVRQTHEASRLTGRLSRGRGVLEIVASPFCDARQKSATPACWFYAAALRRLLEWEQVDARVDIERCRAMGDATCACRVELAGPLRQRRPRIGALEGLEA
jgi:hypothetical protein